MLPNEVQSSTVGKMQRHFDQVASVYPDVRDTDSSMIEAIISQLPHRSHPLNLVDIGCGTGRYSELIVKHLHKRQVRFYCCDYSVRMLRKCYQRMTRKFPNGDIHYCHISANQFPFPDYSFSGIVTFNAIHHFNLDFFLAEAGRVLCAGGLLAIYTRTPEQNSRNIWGVYFPKFAEYETRLYQAKRLRQAIDAIAELSLESMLTFVYKRVESEKSLLNRACKFHYSTFALYPPDELKQAMNTFAQRLKGISKKGVVKHTAENTLVLAFRV